MLHFRKLADGTLFQPHRGIPKGCPDGYEIHSNDPWRCLPILESCKYREQIVIKLKCCRSGRKRMNCTKINYLVTYGNCQKCKGRVQWILDYQKKYGLPEKVRA